MVGADDRIASGMRHPSRSGRGFPPPRRDQRDCPVRDGPRACANRRHGRPAVVAAADGAAPHRPHNGTILRPVDCHDPPLPDAGPLDDFKSHLTDRSVQAARCRYAATYGGLTMPCLTSRIVRLERLLGDQVGPPMIPAIA